MIYRQEMGRRGRFELAPESIVRGKLAGRLPAKPITLCDRGAGMVGVLAGLGLSGSRKSPG